MLEPSKHQHSYNDFVNNDKIHQTVIFKVSMQIIIYKFIYYGQPHNCFIGKLFTPLLYGQGHRFVINNYNKPQFH